MGPKRPKSKKAKGKTGEQVETIEVRGRPENLSARAATETETRQMTNEELWRTMHDAVETACTEMRVGDAEAARRAEEISAWRIGWATLRFAGLGHVDGVVSLSDDPNERDNPRELQDSHVAVLAEVFKTGGKRDLQTPIRIKISRGLIEDRLAQQMSKVNVNDPSTRIPRLVLVRGTAAEEDALEKEIWLESDGKVLLGTNDLNDRIIQLRALREVRPRATLLNGNHRIAAMRAACAPLYREQRDILRAQRAGEPMQELLDRAQRINDQLPHASYVVEVFDGEWLER
ncbi:hypothetical protein FRC08_007936 [Ceratobasidium sp. 394]|nr:hypothetical protein FRC08_007936 [Ceratobasidium sp. 394]